MESCYWCWVVVAMDGGRKATHTHCSGAVPLTLSLSQSVRLSVSVRPFQNPKIYLRTYWGIISIFEAAAAAEHREWSIDRRKERRKEREGGGG